MSIAAISPARRRVVSDGITSTNTTTTSHRRLKRPIIVTRVLSSSSSHRHFSTLLAPTPCLRALERVEVAHLKSYSHPITSMSPRGSYSRGASASHNNNIVNNSSSNYSMEVGMTEDDLAGGSMPVSRVNGWVPMRTLPPSESMRFFFRDEHGGGGGGRGSGDELALDHHHDSNQGGSSNHNNSNNTSHLPPHCVLCREDIEPPFTHRLHVMFSSRASHTNHTCREVSLDSMTLLAMRGYPLESVEHVWADVLYRHKAFTRIHGWVSPRWSLERRADALLSILRELKQQGVVDICLAGVSPTEGDGAQFHHRRRVAFERMEHVGDNAWGTHVSSRIMLLFPDQQWLYSERPYTFNCVRDACEMNIHLGFVFDALHLEELLPPWAATKIGTGKIKADLLEALIGELHEHTWGLCPQLDDDTKFVEVNGCQEHRLLAILEHCLTEIYDLVVLFYVRELSWNSAPLARELASQHLWLQCTPPLRHHKNSLFRRRAAVSAATRHTLPAMPQLFDAATARPLHRPHPLQQLPLEDIPSTTISPHTGQDVFAEFVASFKGLGVLDDDKAMRPPASGRSARPLFTQWATELVPSLQGLMMATTSSSNCSSGGVRGVASIAEEDGQVSYFRDPYYDLFQTPRAVQELMMAVASSSSNEDSISTSSTLQNQQPQLQQQRFRGALQLPAVTPSPDRSVINVHFATSMAHPLLQESSPESAHGQGDSGETGAARACPFAPSQYVPADTRPPSAGVITDRNLHMGTYAFLDFYNICVTTAVGEVQQAGSAAENQDITSAEDASESSSLHSESGSGDGGGAEVVRVDPLVLARKVWQEKWQIENDYFPVRTAAGF